MRFARDQALFPLRPRRIKERPVPSNNQIAIPPICPTCKGTGQKPEARKRANVQRVRLPSLVCQVRAGSRPTRRQIERSEQAFAV